MISITISKDSISTIQSAYSNKQVLHTFLLDENNKVILAGNPLFNPRIEALLFQKLKENN